MFTNNPIGGFKMRLYFQCGKKRIAIDTEQKAYSTNYFFLGGWKEYIKINEAAYREIMNQCIQNGYKSKWNEE
jgi:hypothetical protein